MVCLLHHRSINMAASPSPSSPPRYTNTHEAPNPDDSAPVTRTSSTSCSVTRLELQRNEHREPAKRYCCRRQENQGRPNRVPRLKSRRQPPPSQPPSRPLSWPSSQPSRFPPKRRQAAILSPISSSYLSREGIQRPSCCLIRRPGLSCLQHPRVHGLSYSRHEE